MSYTRAFPKAKLLNTFVTRNKPGFVIYNNTVWYGRDSREKEALLLGDLWL